MKKLFVIVCLICFSMPVFADKILYSYPQQAFYYYYSENFDIKNFSKPEEIIPAYSEYTLFVYDNIKPTDNFKYYGNHFLMEDDPGFMFEMVMRGIENQPKFYVKQYIGENNIPETYICSFDGQNQTKYIYNSETKSFVKQLTFNNGAIDLLSICNPDYIPGQDI